jgi:hypothetical protein
MEFPLELPKRYLVHHYELIKLSLITGTSRSSSDMSSESVPNVATPNAKSYYPFTNPSAGTALSREQWPGNETLPLLFQPILIGKTAKMLFHNRIFVSP